MHSHAYTNSTSTHFICTIATCKFYPGIQFIHMTNNAYLLLKAFVARFAASSEFEMNELVNEETSIEASILHELQGAMVQVI